MSSELWWSIFKKRCEYGEYGCEYGVLSKNEIDMIKSNGFGWGGDLFKSFYDSHHFEVPFTPEELTIQNSFDIR